MTSIPDPCAHSRDSYPGSGPGGGVQPCDPAAQGGYQGRLPAADPPGSGRPARCAAPGRRRPRGAPVQL